MACPDKMKGDIVNTFCGILPSHHNETGCHNESQKRRRVICEIQKLIEQMEQQPMCEEWDTSSTLNNTRGPYNAGEYPKSQGKPWDLNRVKSRELIGSQLIHSCSCAKRNGLQDDCHMTQCHGREWCLTEPLPDCPPFTKIPKEWVDRHPLEMCPNVSPEEKATKSTPTSDLYASNKRVNQ